MKRIMVLALCMVLCAGIFTGCGKKETEQVSVNISELKEEMGQKEDPKGTSQSDGIPLTLGTKVTGTVEKDSVLWYSFQTEAGAEKNYTITLVNTTPASGELNAKLLNEQGEVMQNVTAGNNGADAAISAEDLKTNTTYYICLEAGVNTTDFTLQVSAAEKETETGNSQDDPILLPLNTKVYGTAFQEMYQWYAFTTGPEEQTPYNITVIHGTSGTCDLMVGLYDELGTELESMRVGSGGVPATIFTNRLEPNTTYFVRLTPNAFADIEFSLIVKNPEEKNAAYKTVGTFREARGANVDESGIVTAGISPNDAAFISIGRKVSGSVASEANAWLSFTTGKKAGETYQINVTNKTAKGCDLILEVYDEYGTQVGRNRISATGTSIPLSVEKLEADTTYYIRLTPSAYMDLDYSLIVHDPDKTKKENLLIFETPFEINETQVRFVINQAVFINEDKAKEVLKPVADAILAAPEHAVLIAGTTATDGTQVSCVDLSQRRANAVKKILTDTYGVPESQLKTIGLGYEKDPFERGKDRDANGKFVESEGRKNRRVVVLDIEDPVAKKILENK